MSKFRATIIRRKYTDNWKEGEGDSSYEIIEDDMYDTARDAIIHFMNAFGNGKELVESDGMLYSEVQYPLTNDESILKLPEKEITKQWMDGKFDMLSFEYELKLTEVTETTFNIPHNFEDSILKMTSTNALKTN